jgi:hypothetical protein
VCLVRQCEQGQAGNADLPGGFAEIRVHIKQCDTGRRKRSGK